MKQLNDKTMGRSRHGARFILATFVLAMLAAMCLPAFANLTGAIWTTNSDCTQVDGNIYPSKQAVYMTGGPQNDNSGAMLPPGQYYVKVTEPDGTLLGTSVGDPVDETPFEVDADGDVVGDCLRLWDIVNKASDNSPGYDSTSNPGGEYKLWASKVSDFDNNESKTDNFKVVVVCDGVLGDLNDKPLDCPHTITLADFDTPTTADECAAASLTHGDLVWDENVECPAKSAATLTWTATNCCGQTESVSQKITVVDNSVPEWTDPNPILDPIPGCLGDIIDPTPPPAVSDCSGSFIKVTGKRSDNQPWGAPWPLGTTTITWTALNTCSGKESPVNHFQDVIIKGASICVKKFLDCNNNGVKDEDESFITGWKVTLTDTNTNNPITRDPILTPNCFTDLPPGTYTITEAPSLTGTWINTTPTSVTVVVAPGSCEEEHNATFGNLYIAPSNAKTLGFWSNKNGQKLVGADDLAMLTALNLRNGNGSNFDPANYAALNTWLLNGTAVNMANMLSVQLATMELNVYNGMVSSSAMVYAPGVNTSGIISIGDLMAAANTELGLHPNTVSGSPYRAYQEALKTALDRANNNLNFVSCTVGPFSFAP